MSPALNKRCANLPHGTEPESSPNASEFSCGCFRGVSPKSAAAASTRLNGISVVCFKIEDGITSCLPMSTASQPLVSVIIPTYNYAHFIAEVVASVQSQTYPNWEMIVVDDGSTDNTEEVVKRIAADEPRISYLRQDNARQAAARNNGIRHAKGNYLQFLDADDLIEPQKLEQQVAFLEQHTSVDITHSGVRYFSSERADELLLS